MFVREKSITNILVFQFILLLGIILSIFGSLVYINASASTKQSLDDILYMEMQNILVTLSAPTDKTTPVSEGEGQKNIVQGKCEAIELQYNRSGNKEESYKVCAEPKIAQEVVEPNTDITEMSVSTLDAITQEQIQKASNLGLLVYFLDKKGSIVQSSSTTDFSFIPETSGYFNRFLDNEEYRFYGVSLKNWYLVVGQNVTLHQQQLTKLALNIILLGISTLLFSSIIAFIFIRRALEPFSLFMSEVDSLDPYMLSENKNFADYQPSEVQRLKIKFEQFIKRIVQMLSREKAFMQDISHELRTPLMVIKTSLELLSEPTTQKDKETMSILDDATTRLGNLIGELGFLNQDTQRLRTDEIDMVEFLARFCGQYEILAAQKGLKFSLQLEEDFTIQGNEYLLQKVIGNLISNAIKYTSSGEIFIQLIHPKTLLIRDSGSGIEQGKLEHIFDRFYRANAKTDGFGLGLAIVKKIIDESNWQISFSSVQNKGTTVSINFL